VAFIHTVVRLDNIIVGDTFIESTSEIFETKGRDGLRRTRSSYTAEDGTELKSPSRVRKDAPC
jgi:hypothetical protein